MTLSEVILQFTGGKKGALKVSFLSIRYVATTGPIPAGMQEQTSVGNEQEFIAFPSVMASGKVCEQCGKFSNILSHS